MKLKTAILLLGLIPAAGAVAAPVQWGGNGHWYELVTAPLSFGDAVVEASTRTHLGLGGHLVTITSADENAFVHGLTGGGAAWLGASDAAVEGEWRWMSGPEAGQLLTYSNWGPGDRITSVTRILRFITIRGAADFGMIGRTQELLISLNIAHRFRNLKRMPCCWRAWASSVLPDAG